MNGVVYRLVPAQCESFSISAADLKTGRAGVENIAGYDAVVRSAIHDNAVHTRVSHSTTKNAIVLTSRDFDPDAGTGFYRQAAERHV